MTIEAKIDETNKLLRELIATLASLGAVAPQADAPQPAGASASTPEVATNVTPTDYQRDVRPHMMALVKLKGNVVVRGILESLGVQKATELKPEQWPNFLAKLAAATADDSIPTVGA